MLQGYIVDPETGKVVAVIRHGEVFRDDKEGKIATVLNDNLYDLSGNLVGRLHGQNVIDVRTWTMPAALRKLLAGESAHPVPDVKQKGRPENRPSLRNLQGIRFTLRLATQEALLGSPPRSQGFVSRHPKDGLTASQGLLFY
jgi:hypothetical protein